MMTASRDDLIQQLEDAAERSGDFPRHDLQVLLRRAALCLRNSGRPPVTLDDEYRALIDALNANFGDLMPELEDALSSVAAEMHQPKADLIQCILREWLEANAYLPVPPALDEDSETDGTA
jgi:hypothetical protein